VLLITGPLGVGKSAVADEIFERFCAANLPIAFIAVAALASEVLDRARLGCPRRRYREVMRPGTSHRLSRSCVATV
jgi:putative protein kinase ArgK-like GTPase of G3E family